MGAPAQVGTSRRRDIQGLRAVAVLLVVAFHSGLPVPGGFIGVDVFFVISGYVITQLLLREWQANGSINFRTFYFRRFKRLTPALALTVTVTLIAALFLASPIRSQELAALTGVGSILLVANFVIALTTGGYFDAAAELNPLLNTWSLSVEEQFYLIFPAFLVAALTIAARPSSRLRKNVLPLMISAALVLSLLVAITNGLGVFGSRLSVIFGFYSPVSRAWEFAAGALLVLIGPNLVRFVRRKGSAELLSGLGLMLLMSSALLITDATPFPSAWTVIPVVATLLILLAGTVPTSSANFWLKGRALVTVGDWSYSIYLWHWPLIVFSVVLWTGIAWIPIAAALLSIPIAAASYHLVENPIRRLGRLPTGKNGLLFNLTLAPPIVSAALLWAISAGPLRPAPVVGFEASLGRAPEVSVRGCDSGAPLGTDSWKNCRWGAVGSDADPIYLVGDSNAGHFVEGLAGAAQQADRPLIVATTNACPMVGVGLADSRSSRTWNNTCATYVRDTVRYLRDAAPGTVVIANSDYYWSGDRFSLAAAPGGESEQASLLESVAPDFTAMVKALQASGHKVLLVHTVPQWVGDHRWSPEQCTALEVWGSRCLAVGNETDLKQEQISGRRLLEDASSATGAALVDPWTQLCQDGSCYTSDSSTQVYRDAGHITAQQSSALAAWFSDVLRHAPAIATKGQGNP